MPRPSTTSAVRFTIPSAPVHRPQDEGPAVPRRHHGSNPHPTHIHQDIVQREAPTDNLLNKTLHTVHELQLQLKSLKHRGVSLKAIHPSVLDHVVEEIRHTLHARGLTELREVPPSVSATKLQPEPADRTHSPVSAAHRLTETEALSPWSKMQRRWFANHRPLILLICATTVGVIYATQVRLEWL
jgi:hypothetical protein